MCRLPTQLISGRGKLRSSSTPVDSSRGESSWRWYRRQRRRRRWCAAPGRIPRAVAVRSAWVSLSLVVSLLFCILFSMRAAVEGIAVGPLLLRPWATSNKQLHCLLCAAGTCVLADRWWCKTAIVASILASSSTFTVTACTFMRFSVSVSVFYFWVCCVLCVLRKSRKETGE